MTMTWTAPASAWGDSSFPRNERQSHPPVISGSNLVCYTPSDSLGQQGNTQCVTYLVGVNAPELMYTSYVNGTMVSHSASTTAHIPFYF